MTSFLALPLPELPTEVWSGLIERDYGDFLRIAFVGRGGLIYLKFHALVGREEERDLNDLKVLAPTADEIRRALRWMRAQRLIDEGNHARLARALQELGYEDGLA